MTTRTHLIDKRDEPLHCDECGAMVPAAATLYNGDSSTWVCERCLQECLDLFRAGVFNDEREIGPRGK